LKFVNLKGPPLQISNFEGPFHSVQYDESIFTRPTSASAHQIFFQFCIVFFVMLCLIPNTLKIRRFIHFSEYRSDLGSCRFKALYPYTVIQNFDIAPPKQSVS
jgi:hypothetical protein